MQTFAVLEFGRARLFQCSPGEKLGKALGRKLTLSYMTEMPSLSQQLARAVQAVTAKCGQCAPEVGIVLGSGLGGFADTLREAQRIAYRDIAGMAVSAVEGHQGQLVLGKHGALSVIAMQGRVHLYEGHAPAQVVLGARLMIALGARTLILTNAAGGIDPELGPGDLMLIEDHLNLTGVNVLTGANDDALGPRFVALNDAYDPALRALALRVAAPQGVVLKRGVYAGLLGPTYETPAEVRMLRTLGADAVGMSTVLETIAARHMGARCLGLSCITNRAAAAGETPPDHAEVQRAAQSARPRFIGLLGGVLDALAAEAQA
jgi:purine-nucleoside phosphorylase